MNTNKIDSYTFGHIVIDGKSYSHDVILFPEGIQTEWWREEGHLLQIQDLNEVFASKPKQLFIGTGNSGCMEIDPKVREECEKQSIQYTAKLTEEIIKAYNALDSKEGVIAALHLTC